MAMNKFSKSVRDLVNSMTKEIPESAKKDGVTVINKNGKTYVYTYNQKKK